MYIIEVHAPLIDIEFHSEPRTTEDPPPAKLLPFLPKSPDDLPCKPSAPLYTCGLMKKTKLMTVTNASAARINKLFPAKLSRVIICSSPVFFD